MVLKGHKVDIVTSNPILAKRDAEESEEIYKKFDIQLVIILKMEQIYLIHMKNNAIQKM